MVGGQDPIRGFPPRDHDGEAWDGDSALADVRLVWLVPSAVLYLVDDRWRRTDRDLPRNVSTSGREEPVVESCHCSRETYLLRRIEDRAARRHILQHDYSGRPSQFLRIRPLRNGIRFRSLASPMCRGSPFPLHTPPTDLVILPSTLHRAARPCFYCFPFRKPAVKSPKHVDVARPPPKIR